MATAFSMGAQTETETEHWHIGLSGGFNVSSMRFSDLDKDLFPENKSNFSGVFSPFVEYQFGHENCFAVRAQLAFLTRGGHLSDIGHGYFEGYDPVDEEPWLDDVRYGLKATYFDIRIPLIYQIGKESWRVRPYVYVAPVLGFVTGGHTDARFVMTDDAYEGVRYDLTKANMNGTYFAGALGVGAKYNFDIAGCPFYLGLDLSYQLGFTDTYGSAEKDGDVENVVSFFPTGKKVQGSRKLSGFEMQACVGIPFSVFRKKAPAPVVVEPAPVVEEVVEVVEEPAPVVEEIPCYTLDMITLMMSRGQSVAGKTICAVNDVNFDLDKATIKPSSYDYLNKLAEILKRTGSDIVVKGHTDNTGSDEHNMDLSRRRAETVTDYLIKKGVSASKISYEYFGATKPLTTNDTDEGRKLNRRVEFEILN